MLTTISSAAILLYALATLSQWRVLKGQQQPRYINQLLGALAFLGHSISLYANLHQPAGISLDLFTMGSLVAWLLTAIVLLSSLHQPIDNLFIGVFPIALLALLAASLTPDYVVPKQYGAGLILHVIFSVLAYSILTLAALQAVLVSKQHSALKGHHTRGLVASLPPLQTMDRLLFDMLWSGQVLLTAALISGFIFVDNLFAQQIAHKTILSIMAWVLFVTLICGRAFFGWRSHTATRLIIVGFILLALAFFGSKWVLEVLI